MEKWTESLDKYLEEGKLPLVGEIFSRKKEIGDKLKLQREESHKIALSRRRKQGAGRSFSFSIRRIQHYHLPAFIQRYVRRASLPMDDQKEMPGYTKRPDNHECKHIRDLL